MAKLVSGKVTFVHQRLWPALVVVGQSRATWQLEGLGSPARRILGEIEKSGAARTDALAVALKMTGKEVAKAALDLEKRLLVHATEVHTDSGAHAKELESWKRWARRANIANRSMTSEKAMRVLEAAVTKINEEFDGNGVLCWQGRVKSRP